MKGGAKVVVEPHRHAGVFVAKGKEDALVTKNLDAGNSVYGEKRISVEVCAAAASAPWHRADRARTDRGRRQDRVPCLESLPLKAGRCHCRRCGEHLDRPRHQAALPGRCVGHHRLALLGRRWTGGRQRRNRALGRGSWVCALQEGLVYAVEFSHRSGRDLINVAKRRRNVIPIIEDARHPLKYRMLVGMVDVVFADVAQVRWPSCAPPDVG
jgi:rRNA 2'-O-methyltransferase fibrillarin